jgi:hypothetical protein
MRMGLLIGLALLIVLAGIYPVVTGRWYTSRWSPASPASRRLAGLSLAFLGVAGFIGLQQSGQATYPRIALVPIFALVSLLLGFLALRGARN